MFLELVVFFDWLTQTQIVFSQRIDQNISWDWCINGNQDESLVLRCVCVVSSYAHTMEMENRKCISHVQRMFRMASLGKLHFARFHPQHVHVHIVFWKHTWLLSKEPNIFYIESDACVRIELNQNKSLATSNIFQLCEHMNLWSMKWISPTLIEVESASTVHWMRIWNQIYSAKWL